MTPDRILRDLNELWVTLGEQKAAGSGGVVRACTMTLLVLADESDDASRIWELLAALMPRHPSRAVLIRFRRGSERQVDARVFAQCWLPFGQRQQICCEQIEISATDASLPDLPGLVLPIAAADLPVVLYCRCPRLFASPHLNGLASEAGKIVVDSALFGDTPGALRMLASRGPAGPAVADLAWARLTRWREAVAELFEAQARRDLLPAATEVRVGTVGAWSSPEACYLAAWLLGGIARVGGAARAALENEPGEPPGEIRRIVLRGGALDLAVGPDKDGAAARPPEYAALGEELGVWERDQVFEETLPAAARLAVSLGK